MKSLTLVVAMSENGVIGHKNTIPWNVSEDRRHFVKVTKGHSIIMGRSTWDSIGRPLPNRRNIVLSRNHNLTLQGAEVAHTLLEAIEIARQTDPDPRIIGGGLVYAESLALASNVIVTIIPTYVEGDTYFPTLSYEEWVCTDTVPTRSAVYRTYERVTV